MRPAVLATAGHIDHGKTELVKALTGIDTDRLPEEKARGITIDLGFAHAEIAGRPVSFVDVPGHERFVKNMLAGVGGIDLALLVVAADESVMPQTREHMAILGILAVPSLVVALTKIDLVDAETLDLARQETVEFLRARGFAGAPVVPVSARSAEGLPALVDTLSAALGGLAERDADGPLRLHVDRAFSIRGFGSVVTGTVVSGEVGVGDEVEVSPLLRPAKVRGIEVHGRSAERARAGSRGALNLAGIDLALLERGQQVLAPGLFPPTQLVDARVRLLAGAAPLKDLARVRFHLGAGEFLARVKLLGVAGPRLGPGEEALVQLRLERPTVALPGDRFILRSYSPVATIGGGSVIEPASGKHRGRAAEAVAHLNVLGEATPSERLRELVAASGQRGVTVTELVARSGRLGEQVEADLGRLEGLVRVPPARLFGLAAWEAIEVRAVALVSAFHARNPLKEGMSREELKTRVFGDDPAAARELLERLSRRGTLRLIGEAVALATHKVTLNQDESRLKEKLEAAFRAARFQPPLPQEVIASLAPGERPLAAKLLPVLSKEGRLVSIPGGLLFHAEALAELKLVLGAERGKRLSVADFKRLTGTSRKHAIPLLEHLDQVRFTRREGDLRLVLGGPPEVG